MQDDKEALEGAIREHCAAARYERAATVAIRAYGPEILGFLVSHLHDKVAAGDVLSTMTEDLWRGLPRFEWRCTLRTWAYTLARHAASRYQESARRNQKGLVPLSRATALSRAVQEVRSRTITALRTASRSRIAALRERLPIDDRDLLVLRVNRRLEWREIARVLANGDEDVNEDALEREATRLRKRFQIVKDQLRKMASDEGLLDEHRR